VSTKLRFGIAGCGVIAPHHAAAIAELSDQAELVAVSDVVADKAQELAKTYGADWYESSAEMLRRPDIDAVCICTPSGMHGDHAVAALLAGKHVIIEKPVEITLPAIDRILAAQRESGKKAAVIFQHRFDASSRIVKDAARENRFGRLSVAAAQIRWWRSQAYYDSGDWRGTWALDGGGCLMNQGIHTIDLMQWVMGPVVEVSAYTALRAHERVEVEDTAVATVKFESGALGIIEGTTAAYPGLTTRLDVHGEFGSAVIEGDKLQYIHMADPGGESGGSMRGTGNNPNRAEELLAAHTAKYGRDPASITSYPWRSIAHIDQIKEFITAVRADREPLVNVAEGRKAVSIILAIYESARTGRPVKVG